jgi:hypothetical protein
MPAEIRDFLTTPLILLNELADSDNTDQSNQQWRQQQREGGLPVGVTSREYLGRLEAAQKCRYQVIHSFN